MKTSRLALVVITAGLLCAGNAGCKDENKDESDAAAVRFGKMLRDMPPQLFAAELGDTEAMYNLGIMYAKGDGVIEDDKEAVKWYRKAAELGYTDAMNTLGLMYDNGESVIEDDVEAYAWFNVAAANGDKEAAESRDKIKKNMTPEQIAEGQKRSREIIEAISKK